MTEIFTADISGMPCSLFLVTKRGKLYKKKSSVQCITNQTVHVSSAVVINDNTDHIFELKLKAKDKKTNLIRGMLLPTPKDVNLATKFIQQQGSSDDPKGYSKIWNSVNCTYQNPAQVPWTQRKTKGIRTKALHLIDESQPRACLEYRTMSEKCNGNNGVSTSKVHPRKEIDDGDTRHKVNIFRNARITKYRKWPENVLYYQFDQSVTTNDRNVINHNLDSLQKQLGQCVQFVQRNHSNRVLVKSDDKEGCSSDTGYKGKVQLLHLHTDKCMKQKTIQHEFLHALGIHHTQSRWDRDDYVKILYENIKTNRTHNFKKYKKSEVSHYNLPYDYLSVMHYKNDSWSKNKTLNTIEARDPFWTDKLGRGDGPSLGDINLVQMHYRCPVAIQWKGKWGSFASSPTFCPTGSFAFGYRLKSAKGKFGEDNTALYDIELYCRRPFSQEVSEKIWSDFGTKGSWSSDMYCSGTNNPIIGFDVIEEGFHHMKNSKALNAVGLHCKDGDYISANEGPAWGSLKKEQICPVDYAVMGIRTQVQEDPDTGDGTAISGIELYCMPYPLK